MCCAHSQVQRVGRGCKAEADSAPRRAPPTAPCRCRTPVRPCTGSRAGGSFSTPSTTRATTIRPPPPPSREVLHLTSEIRVDVSLSGRTRSLTVVSFSLSLCRAGIGAAAAGCWRPGRPGGAAAAATPVPAPRLAGPAWPAP